MIDHATRAIINLWALRQNLYIIKQRIGANRRILAVVKANAYGHGLLETADCLQKMGVSMLGVAYIEEGIALRDAGIDIPVLVMTPALPYQIESALKYDLILTLSDIDNARAISLIASRMNISAKVHIKIDTGMGRLGLGFEGSQDAVSTIYSLPNLIVEGIFTHLATADESDPCYTQYQIQRFKGITDSLSISGIHIPTVHMGNSAAVIQHPETYMDMVRVGIMLYGVAPRAELQNIVPIFPVMTIMTKVIHLKMVAKGSSISYGRLYISPSDRLIGVIAAGYSDGFARSMSGKAHVLIHGEKAPVVGAICMDMSIVDLTDIKGVKVGDDVMLLGRQGKEHITAHDWAKWQQTIPYEILCAIGQGVTRVYIDKDLYK
ncbi:alanine racemase [bacterium]|nr:alanine racemase [bacterium]